MKPFPGGKDPEYKLVTMADLLQIPVDRFDDFIVDLKEWHRLGKQTVDMLNTIGEAIGQKDPPLGMNMRWIDDGKHDKKIIIKSGKKS